MSEHTWSHTHDCSESRNNVQRCSQIMKTITLPSLSYYSPAVRRNMKAPQTFNASMPVSLRCLCWSLMMMNGVPNSSKPNDPGMKDMIPSRCVAHKQIDSMSRVDSEIWNNWTSRISSSVLTSHYLPGIMNTPGPDIFFLGYVFMFV